MTKAWSGSFDEWTRQLALDGAKQRLAQLDEERAKLLGAFPELARKGKRPASVLFDAAAPVVPNGHRNGATPKLRRKRSQWTDEQRKQAIALFKKRMAQRAIADAVGVSLTMVHRFLKGRPETAGETSKRIQGQHATDADKAKALRLIADGQGNARIAKQIGVTHTTIRRWRIEARAAKRAAAKAAPEPVAVPS